ncbi:MAG: Gfo/Idh/MocA family protein [Candidatus Zipacnadales bacterium]
MDKVRLGIIGTGGIAKSHLEGYRTLLDAGFNKFEITALCDNNTERRGAFAAAVKEMLGWEPAHFGSAEEIAASGTIDAADICTPHGFHHTTAIPCLEAGIDVMVEKPCGITVKASDLIIAAAEKTNRLIAVAEQVRRGIKARAMKWAVTEAKMIGDIRFWSVVGFSAWDFGAENYTDAYAWQWRLLKLLTGGGMIFDAGAHFADMMLHLFGPVDEVYAWTHSYQAPLIDSPELGPRVKDVEDTWMTIWKFANGIVGQYSWSVSAPGESVATQIFYGTEGSARDRGGWMHTFQNGGDLTLADGMKKTYEEIEPEFRAQLDEATRDRLFPYGVENDIALECWDFIDSVLTRRRPEISAEDTKLAKSICLAIYESALAGIPIKVGDVFEGIVSAYQDPINQYWGI